ncbi:MAG: hypothetical protein M1308_01390, partial [Actinobacteria bacterium]|nr:hypothetical protein [Actinomycetota bacterium]
NWQYGYNGVEPSAAIFTSLPSIARGLDIPGVNDALSGLSLIFHKPNATDPAVILKMLQDFTVKYIILHKDMDWKKMALEDPEQEKMILDNLPYLEKKGIYDNLIIYGVVPERFQPKIIISGNFELASLNPNGSIFWPWMIADTNKDMVTAMDQKSQAQILNKTKGKIIFPTQSSFSRQENSSSDIKQITQFNISSSGTYELVLTGAQTDGAYLNGFNKLDLLIDGTPISLTRTIKGQLISFGSLNLNAGSHEIIFLPPESINLFPSFNLVQASEDVKLLDNSIIQISASAKNLQFIAGELLKVYGGDVYNISFEYKFAGKKGFYLLMAQDTDPDKMNPALAELNKVESDKWQQYNNILSPLRLNTQKSALEIVFNPETSQILDTQSILQIRNIKVERLFNNLVFLRQESMEQIDTLNGFVDNYERINAGFYEGKLKIIKPALLIFKETYHPGWKLELSENISQGKKFRVENHYLGNLYANAWFVDKPGDYNFKIIFEPQSYITKGVIIAISSLVGIILLAVYNVLKINRKK